LTSQQHPHRFRALAKKRGVKPAVVDALMKAHKARLGAG